MTDKRLHPRVWDKILVGPLSSSERASESLEKLSFGIPNRGLRRHIVVGCKPKARLNIDCIEPTGFVVKRNEDGSAFCCLVSNACSVVEDEHVFQRPSEEYLTLAGVDSWWDQKQCVPCAAYRAELLHIPVRGLRNQGENLCFLNVVFQALLSLPAFRTFLTHCAALQPLHNSQVLSAIVSDWKNYKKESKASMTSRPIKAANLANCICLFEDTLGNAQLMQRNYGHHQHDPHEFLEWLLDTIHEEVVRLVAYHSSLLLGSEVGTVGFGANVEEWTEVGKGSKSSTVVEAKFDESAISELFRVMIRSVFKKQGHKASARVEPSFALPISIDRVASLQEAIERHMETERIVVDHAPATKTSTFETLPPVIIFQLKRFEMMDGVVRKTHKRVAFPSTFAIPSRMVTKYASASYSREYQLRGVIAHHGETVNSGHYTCAIRSPISGAWQEVDDEQCFATYPNAVAAMDPYVLLYERKPTAPR